ncbi:hypothetical protein PWY87_04940 [Kribbella solani]|uniref:hypothetical protein n=1 Tax=Kribbella solani TaxID=236067 RepID=UPI0029B69852|nr:hypothetical protein [Kribbella solani]MDX3001005.1 hypothetical protein [Kribbella solani]
MAGDGREFEERNRRLDVTAIVAGVSAFDGSVRVIEKSTKEWSEYTRRVLDEFDRTDQLTEVLRRGLPGFDHGPGWRSRKAVVDALRHPEVEYAVLVEAAGDGPVTVVTFKEAVSQGAAACLEVVGGGTTFPPPADVLRDVPRLSDQLARHVARLKGDGAGHAAQLSAKQAGYVAQYALATIAADQGFGVTHRASPDSWHGPRGIEGRWEIDVDGQTGDIQALSWSAADAQHIAEQVTLRQPSGLYPYQRIAVPPARDDTFRRLATQLSGWLERGGTIDVCDHGDEGQKEAADVAVLALEPPDRQDAREPIPDQAGVRTIVARLNGRPQAAVTFGRRADGGLQVLRLLGSEHPGADQAAELMLFQAAVRVGGGVSYAPDGAIDFLGHEAHIVSPDDVSSHVTRLQNHLRQVDRASSDRMTELVNAHFYLPEESAVDPDALAAQLQRFHEAGGDVLYLSRSDPNFSALRAKVADRMVAAIGSDGSIPPDLESLWRVFNSPVTESGQPVSGLPDSVRERVAVAVKDGIPVAAAAVRATGFRCEIKAFGAVSGADDGLVAAVVDGVYPRFGAVPLVMFWPDDEARPEQLAALGLEKTGIHALDDDGRVEIRLSDATRASIDTIRSGGWMSSRQLEVTAINLEMFQEQAGAVRRLNHADAGQRQAAEDIIRATRDMPDWDLPESPLPPVNGNRVTLVAQGAMGAAYLTFDETPDGQVEVVDIAAHTYASHARHVLRHGFCAYLAEQGTDAVLHERITGKERDGGIWGAAESRYVVTGMRNRLGAEAVESLLPAPEPAATPESAQPTETAQSKESAQSTESEQSTGGGKSADGGKGEAPRRPDRPDGRGGPMER